MGWRVAHSMGEGREGEGSKKGENIGEKKDKYERDEDTEKRNERGGQRKA